jgi:thiosulfate/3-mercaptopyruvate sulfurtransferase
MASPLITAAELRRQVRSGPPALLDVRWDLATGAQRDAYERGHVPGAAFVDLDRDLSGEPGPRGRHPLPEPDRFAQAMRAAGVSSDRSVVVYDGGDGFSAARCWWLLRYFGNPSTAVLDGGLEAWTAAGGELSSGPQASQPGTFAGQPGGMPVLDADAAAALVQGGVLLDARAPERFRGEVEPIDPVAGHIPGASNRPATLNLTDSGAFADPDELRRDFERLGIGPDTAVGAYCGSGVSAAQLVLALELAGTTAALYPGSWSEWSADPNRPVATGP